MFIFLLCAFVVLVIVAQRFIYKKLWDTGLTYKVNFSKAEIFEGEMAYIKEEIANKKFLPLPFVYTDIDASQTFEFERGRPSGVFALKPYTITTRRHHFKSTKRGVYSLKLAQLKASDLVHLSDFKEEKLIRAQILVFPKILPHCPDMSNIISLLDSDIAVNKIINPDPFEFKGIRDYQPTDPLKSINFKASAVGQNLMVNIYAPTTAKKLVILLGLDPTPAWESYARQEEAIRIAATLASEYTAQGAHIALITNGRDQLTLGEMRVPSGTGHNHLYKTFQALARISNSHLIKPMATAIDEILYPQDVYVLISPYQGAELKEAFAQLKQRGGRGITIAPTFKDKTSTPDIVYVKCES